MSAQTCGTCPAVVQPLEVFPGAKPGTVSCLACYAKRQENQPMPTARDIVRMWGGK